MLHLMLQSRTDSVSFFKITIHLHVILILILFKITIHLQVTMRNEGQLRTAKIQHKKNVASFRGQRPHHSKLRNDFSVRTL